MISDSFMPYKLFQADSVSNSIKELAKRNPELLRQLEKKIRQILGDPYKIGKWMRGNYVGIREVHIYGKRFVLYYTIDEKIKQVNLVNFEHHPEKY
jgi:addiction module RelE/StbE family toxin